MRTLFLGAAMAISAACNAQFVLEGKMTETRLSQVYLSYADSKGARRTDSALVQNGKFRFSGDIREPAFAALSAGRGNRMVEGDNFRTIVLEPGRMAVVMAGDNFRDITVTGSPSHTEFSGLEEQVNSIRERWKVVMDTLSAVNKRSNAEYQELKNWVLKPYNAEVNQVYSKFFAEHPSSFISAYYIFLQSRSLSADSLKKMYSRLSPQVKQSTYGKNIYQEIEKKKIGIPGAIAPDFSATDIDGKQLKLSAYQGRYVLLDFWASWCVPCRKGNPHLIKAYNQYKSRGLEIVGISDDDRNPEAWKKAVEQDGIGIWKHVLRGLDMEKRMRNEANPNDIAEKYNISSLPTKILINKEGIIVGRYNSEEDAALDEKLAELMPAAGMAEPQKILN